MPRGIGEASAVADLPEWIVFVAGLVTQLGDMWFVLVAIVGLYVLGQRSSLSMTCSLGDALFLFALAIGAYALTVILKYTFALPRPPGAGTAAFPTWLPAIADPIYASMVTADGFGFPSGHALKATAMFGGAALTLQIRHRRRQAVVAALAILLVALSRVVLGVHYLVDIVAGLAVGLVFLAVMTRLAKDRPRRALIGAALLGVIAVAMAATTKAALVVLAAIVGLGISELSVSKRVPEVVRGA